MIGSLNGTLLQADENELLLEVNGIGYRISATPDTIASLGSAKGEVLLYISHQVRENDEKLYGFPSNTERRYFETLMGANKIGPAMALSICSVHNLASMKGVLSSQDVDALCLVPGIGKKTAQSIMVDLQNKLDIPETEQSQISSVMADTREALVGLGYSGAEVQKTLTGIYKDQTAEELLKEALAVLGSGK